METLLEALVNAVAYEDECMERSSWWLIGESRAELSGRVF